MTDHCSPADILEWSQAKFGEKSTIDICLRANLEASELISAIHHLEDIGVDKVVEEIADVYIVTCQATELLGVELNDEDRLHPDGDRLQLAMEISHCLMLSVTAQRRMRLGVDPCQVVISEMHLRTVLYLCHRICRAYGRDLQDEVDKKMSINFDRRWVRAENGHFQHT